MTAAPSASRAGTGSPSTTTAAAPEAIAPVTKRRASTRRPRRAKNTAPGTISRLSSYTAVTSRSSAGGTAAYPSRSAASPGAAGISCAATFMGFPPESGSAMRRQR